MNRYLLDDGKHFLFYLLIALASSSISAQVTYEEAFPNLEFNFPVEIQNAGDGGDRLFVVEQTGRIKVFPNTAEVSSQNLDDFLDISEQISYSAGQEIGLLGLAFHPNYSQNGYFFVYYTRESNISGANTEIVLSRFTVSDDPNLADATSGVEIFSFDKNQLDSNHNGGKIAFGPDGYLYVSVGDGGGAGDPNDNAQNLDNVFGGILRIDVDINGSNPIENNNDLPNGNYEIPSGNPRIGQDGLDEFYAWGLRNTWKFSFDGQTGNLWAADVGQGDFEEINLITLGGNYGWDRFEATSIFDSGTSLATDPDIEPIYSYDHDQGDVSITGGYVYRGSSTNELLNGKYVYGDYVSGRVWSLDYDSDSGSASSTLLFRTNGEFISSFGLDEAGELYFSDYGSSAKIYRISGGTVEPEAVPTEGIGFWENLGNEMSGTVNAIALTRTDSVFVGGDFNIPAEINADNLATYEPGTGWNNFGTGTNGKVDAIIVSTDGKVIIGGSFSSVDGTSANNIAVWENDQWAALGEGTDGPVQAMSLDASNNLYVGGSFQNADGVPVRNIARWSDGEWSALTDENTGIQGTNNEVRSIAVGSGNTLYIGGNFDEAGGNPASRIAVWNAGGWETLGTGTSGFVQAILLTDDYIYAGGNFSLAGDQTVNRIARWSIQDSAWEALGNGVSGNVNSLEYDGTYLYVGGSFETTFDSDETEKVVHNIARWGSAIGWEALGTQNEVGVTVQVSSLAFDSDLQGLYVGGNFSEAGDVAANNIAIWREEEEQVQVLTDDNFTIAVGNSACPDVNTGSLSISTNQTAGYELALSSESVVTTFDFTDALEIPDLAPGTYELTLTAAEQPDFNANFTVTIATDDPLQVAAQQNNMSKTVTLNMTGGNTYSISVNGETIQTMESTLTVDLVDTITEIVVTTEEACKGSFEETFTLSEEQEEEVIIAYPNPFNDVVNLGFTNLNDGDQIRVSIYVLSGAQVLSQLYEVQNNAIAVDTSILADGIYIVRLRVGESVKVFKLAKN